MTQKTFGKLFAPGEQGRPGDHWLALAALSVMMIIDWNVKPTISPLMSMICFGYFAHRMRPRFVAGWVLLFTLASCFFLFEPWLPAAHSDRVTVYIRIATIALGAVGAVVLSLHRVRVAGSLHQTLTILEKLPAPVIISDSAGGIVLMNEDALILMDTTVEQALGSSYFTFLAETEKGQTIQKYLEIVDSGPGQPVEVVMELKKPRRRKINATLVAIQTDHTRLLATVLRPIAEIPLFAKA